MLKSIPFYASLLGWQLTDKIKATNSQVLIYGAIEVHAFGAKGCIASNELIASETGLKKSTVKNCLSQMVSAGWIEIIYKDETRQVRKKIIPRLQIISPKIRPQEQEVSFPHYTPVTGKLHPRHSHGPIDNNRENILDNTLAEASSAEGKIDNFSDSNPSTEVIDISTIRTRKEGSCIDGQERKETEQIERTQEAFNSQKFVQSLLEDKKRHIRLIGRYFLEDNKNFPSHKSALAELRRWVKDASVIAEYPEDRIDRTFIYAQKEYPKVWNLSTIAKLIPNS